MSDLTSPTKKKDWAEDSDSDDDPEELRRAFGSPKKSVDSQKEQNGESGIAPITDDKPVASLLSRISGLSTDPAPVPASPSSSSTLSAASAPFTPPSAAASTSRPKPNTNNNLFGKALAGVKSDRASVTAPTPAAAPPVSLTPTSAEKETTPQVTEPVQSTSTSAPAPSLEEKKEADMTNIIDEPLDDGWGWDGPTAVKDDAASTKEASMASGSSDSGLISNNFQVEVKLADLQADPNSPLYSISAFEDLPIHPDLMKGIYAVGFKKPSKIQEKALPMLLNNPPRNLIGQSQSGTGKTAAFTLNMLSRVDPAILTPQVICLCPSRELARQTQEVIDKIGQFTQISTMLAVPGSWSRNQKIDKHILIGTPGTFIDMIARKVFDPKAIRVLVLDEADEMLNQQGQGDQTTRIKRALPPNVQNVLFSATFPDDVQDFADRFAPEANKIFLKMTEVTVDAIKQLYLECEGEEGKFEALGALYDSMTIGQSIVFCKKRDTADEIAKRLTEDGHSVASLHGEKMHGERDDILDGFRNGKTKVLITTNVIARGIDILQVNMVVNYDVPTLGPEGHWKPDVETYIHRIGRTGRFGRKGCSITFVHDQRSMSEVEEIMQATGRRMKKIDARNEHDLEQLGKALKIAMKGI
ncbi:P-loop containing nucleoside triphosphate hydrolase protein [Naematelia encephala]|uniref:RNA helicase n=1 Tax=Naematelia encephala TaxID=71784 RepID=A0A1Y2B9W4_9TREE|nr:P-loop containing nucleoside triphosphate hydrolase protein [Naematelia encephala]